MFGTFLFSHSAYGASYLNVSSSAPEGLVKFSKVQPSSSGEMSTAEDTLTVNTNCTVGYSVYVSAINGGDTNLTNDSASASGNNTIAPSSATVGGTATVLSANTWGINGSSSEVEDGKYFGLPAYASATASALTTRSNVEEQTTVPIYYGAKVTTAIAPGSYAGDVLYTVLPSSACTYYTVAFDANGGTGTMDNQTINVGETTALSENTFTRSGYTFLGWSNSANGKTGTATNGVGTMADVDYTNKQEVTDISDFNTTKNLYAIWAQISGDMQTWTGCPALASDSTVYLRDARDDTVYAVKKLADGKCWMTDNLILGHDKGYALTSELTNIPDNDDGTLSNNGTYYLPQAGYSGALNSSSTTGPAVFDTSTRLNQAQVQYRAQGSSGDQQSSGTLGQNTGYYNFYAATLGCSYYLDGLSSGQCASGYIQKDICPKGWHLPTGVAGGQFAALDIALNPDDASAGTKRTNTTSRDRFLDQASFLYSGRYYSSQLYYVGSYGHWWSSTVNDTNRSYLLYLNSNGYVNPRSIDYKYYGFAVRCVAQNNYTVSYNANNGSGAASKASDSIYETGELTTAGQGTLSRDGYNFLGWSLDSNATTATYSANTAISVPDLITAAGSPASGSTITLYAVWEQAIDGDMQSWAGCGALSASQEVKLRDTRDNKIYAVKKLPDGKCWMVQNLALGMNATATGLTLTPANTNIDNNTTYYLPPAGKQGSITSSSTLTSTTAANFSTSNDNQAKTQFRTKDSSITNDSDTGYYNFYTATLGYTYNGSGSSGSSTRDICPKGWRLPKTTDSGTNVTTTGSANDFTYLARQYSTSGWSGSATGTSGYGYYNNTNAVNGPMYTSAAANGNNYAGFSYSGFWNGTNTSASDVGSFGYYWSSSVYSIYNGYLLVFYSSDVYPQYYRYKYGGGAVRCIAKDITSLTYMQDITPEIAANTSVGTSATLKDSRDNKAYTVKKLPDGKVWMMQNLTLGDSNSTTAQRTLTSANTNIDNGTTYYLPPAGKQGDITSSSTLTSTTAADFSTTSNDNQAKTQFRTKDSSVTNDSDTGYYNFYAATLGFSYYNDGKTSGSSTRDICPKGWRLPKTTDAGTTVSAITSVNDFTYLTRLYSTSNWTGTATSPGYFTTNSAARTGIHTGAAANGNNYAGFSYSGSRDGTDSSASLVGSQGFYWSSSVYNTISGYFLNFSSSLVSPQNTNHKRNGFAVRCIAKS